MMVIIYTAFIATGFDLGYFQSRHSLVDSYYSYSFSTIDVKVDFYQY